MTHEDFSRKLAVRGLSDRKFGLVFAAVVSVIGLLPRIRSHPVRWRALIVAGAFLGAALVAPTVLTPLQRLLARFGQLVNSVACVIVSTLLLLLVFGTPTSLNPVVRA